MNQDPFRFRSNRGFEEHGLIPGMTRKNKPRSAWGETSSSVFGQTRKPITPKTKHRASLLMGAIAAAFITGFALAWLLKSII
jgi:hypothetical protein